MGIWKGVEITIAEWLNEDENAERFPCEYIMHPVSNVPNAAIAGRREKPIKREE